MNKCQHCGFETRYNPLICPMCNQEFKEKGIISRDEDQKNLVKKISGTRVQYFIVKSKTHESPEILPDIPY